MEALDYLVSSDFINELRIALKNKTEKINDLVLLLSQDKRDTNIEQNINPKPGKLF